MNPLLYTIGHSNHEIAVFIGLLRQHGVTAIGNVRSQPYSRYVPQYSRDAMETALVDAGIAYVFLGKELEARSDNPHCYREGKIQFDRLAREPIFAEGIGRVMQGIERCRIALTCAEKDPLDCHRALLVARKLLRNRRPGQPHSRRRRSGGPPGHGVATSGCVQAAGGRPVHQPPRVRRRRLSYSRRAGRLPGKNHGTSQGATSRGGDAP